MRAEGFEPFTLFRARALKTGVSAEFHHARDPSGYDAFRWAARAGDDAAMDDDQIRSDPDEQAARGLTPDDSAPSRPREPETDETKYKLAAEQTAPRPSPRRSDLRATLGRDRLVRAAGRQAGRRPAADHVDAAAEADDAQAVARRGQVGEPRPAVRRRACSR